MHSRSIPLSTLESPILSIAPIEHQDALLILTAHMLYHFNMTTQHLQSIMQVELPPLPESRDLYRPPHYQLYSSPSGLYSAVVIHYGKFGLVFDHQQQRVILKLDCKTYYEDMVPFSLAFSTFEQDEIVIYRSDWNRLDTFNLTQNISSTERFIAPYKDERPEHYLDYFHGALYLSPKHDYILDDGWVWHPYGYPQVWSLPHWLKHNPYESEDGKSLQSFVFDEESWDYPMCWLDDNTFALWQTTLRAEENGGEGHESVACLHLRICQVVQNPNIKNQALKNDIWRFPQQMQKLFNIYVDDGKLIFVGNENISLYDLRHLELIAQIPNNLPYKQHLKRHSVWAFKHQDLIEWQYNNTGLIHA